jgi:hypothetical protein
VTLSHVRDGLSVRRMAVLWPCSMLPMYRHVHRQFVHNEVHNFYGSAIQGMLRPDPIS